MYVRYLLDCLSRYIEVPIINHVAPAVSFMYLIARETERDQIPQDNRLHSRNCYRKVHECQSISAEPRNAFGSQCDIHSKYLSTFECCWLQSILDHHVFLPISHRPSFYQAICFAGQNVIPARPAAHCIRKSLLLRASTIMQPGSQLQYIHILG